MMVTLLLKNSGEVFMDQFIFLQVSEICACSGHIYAALFTCIGHRPHLS